MVRTLSKPESIVDPVQDISTISCVPSLDIAKNTVTTIPEVYDSPIKHIHPLLKMTELEEEPYTDSHVMSPSEGVGSESINHD